MYYNSLYNLFHERRHEEEKGISFIDSAADEVFLSYSDLYAFSKARLVQLQKASITSQDELVFQVVDLKEFIVTFWACILGGIVPVPLTVGTNDDHRQKLVNVWGLLDNPALISTNKEFERLSIHLLETGKEELFSAIQKRFVAIEGLETQEETEPVLHEPKGQDLAYIQFSSGSTGSPKGVRLTHRNLLANVEAIAAAAAYKPEDTLLSWMPLTHDMGLIGLHINPMFSGMHHYLMSTSLFVRRPALWMSLASEKRISILASPNFGYQYLLRHVDLSQQNWDLSSVRLIYNGAEPISASLCSEFTQAMKPFQLSEGALRPVYGLAEASLAVTISDLGEKIRSIRLERDHLNVGDAIIEATHADGSVSFVEVGKPIKYVELRIASDDNVILDEGKVGHIQIKGENITQGYHNNAAATSALFTEDSWLRTGDLGFRKDSSLYVTGRHKDIFFINGQNYYPHDVERVAEAVEGIELNKIVVGGHYNEQLQHAEVLAFVFYRGKTSDFVPLAQELKSHINQQTGIDLHAVIPVKDIPRTTSGKLQRFKMVQQYQEGQFDGVLQELQALLKENNAKAEPAASPEEKALLDIWKQVFKTDQIGVTDRFFEIGGNSLRGAEMAMLVQRVLDIELEADLIAFNPDIRTLAVKLRDAKKSAYHPIPVSKDKVRYPLTSAQERLYYQWETDKEGIAYNVPTAIRLEGKVDVTNLEYCLSLLLERHDAFRIRFGFDQQPYFSVLESAAFQLEQELCAEEDMASRLAALVCPFDLNSGRLYRFCLLQLDSGAHVLFMDFHHIISDGLSQFHFLQELLQAYSGEVLPHLPAGYRDYALWEQKVYEPQPESAKYWTTQLAGELPVLNLPADFPRKARFEHAGAKIAFDLSADQEENLRQLAMVHGCSMHVLLFSCYQLWLHKQSGQEDIITGIPVAGRKHPDTFGMQGMFVNNLALRTSLDTAMSFVDLLAAVNASVKEALAHQDYPFSAVLQDLDLPRNPSRNLLFDTMFNYQNMGFPVARKGQPAISPVFFDPCFAKFDLSLEVFDAGQQLSFALEYASHLFSQESARGMASSFVQLVENILAAPTSQISQLSLLSAKARQAILEAPLEMVADPGDLVPVIRSFELKVGAQPDSIAIEAEGRLVTYQELNHMANVLASKLAGQGIGKDDLVAIRLPRSIEYVTGVLAVLKAGAAFLPVDIELPQERVRYLLEDSAAKALITNSEVHEHLALVTLPEITSYITDQINFEESVEEVQAPVEAADLAYTIYTSGTTGKPKGVMIGHLSLSNYVQWAAEKYLKGEEMAFPLFTSVSFDLTVTSVFVPLVTGNKLVIYQQADEQTLVERVFAEKKVQIVKLTPSHLRLLAGGAEAQKLKDSGVKRLIVGGEALDASLAREITALWKGGIEIYNEYGPTEATVGCMIHQFDPATDRHSVPIGIPASHTRIYLLDAQLEPVGDGVYGELYVAGLGLARAYLNKEVMTAERFIDNPFVPGTKMYRTGDIARRLPNGLIDYIGRKDQQVKINGYRIELAEIESCLKDFECIRDAVVRLRKSDKAQQQLIDAYYTIASGAETIAMEDLRAFMAQRLPYYMLPQHYAVLEQIPLTTNGKVNYAALPDPVETEKAEAANDLEHLSVSVWEAVLEQAPVSVSDNFFELGGDSIKAVQISSRMLEKGIAIDVKDILTYQTIRQVSLHARLQNGTGYEQGQVSGEFGHSPITYWFSQLGLTKPEHYHQSVLLKAKTNWDKSVLEQAFDKLVHHHDSLRINYRAAEGRFYYTTAHLEMPFVLEEVVLEDLSQLPARADQLRAATNLEEGLLIKALIVRERSGTDQYLFIAMHHLIADGLSWRILLEDLHNCYQALQRGEEVRLSAKTASLIDWSEALKQEADAMVTTGEEQYWNSISAATTDLPKDFENTTHQVANQRSVRFELSASDTDFLLREAHEAYKTDVPILLNTALARALRDWTGQADFVVEHENHGRHLENINVSRTIGWFTALYPVQLSVQGDEPGANIKQIKEQLRQVPNKGLGYGLLQQRKGSRKESPARLRFNYLGAFGKELSNELFALHAADTGSESSPENNSTALIEINLMVVEGVLRAEAHYDAMSFASDTMERFLDGFGLQLNKLLEHIRGEEDIHFTVSDFDVEDLSQHDLDTLFD